MLQYISRFYTESVVAGRPPDSSMFQQQDGDDTGYREFLARTVELARTVQVVRTVPGPLAVPPEGADMNAFWQGSGRK